MGKRNDRRLSSSTDLAEEVEAEYGYGGAVLATVGWYAVPLLLYVVWALLLDGGVRPGCVDATGGTCLAPRVVALHNLADGFPRIELAIVSSLLVAILIRWVTGSWRGLTVGFTATLVGAATAAALFSLLTTAN